MSGADPETLEQCPRDRIKFFGLGGVVLTTAVMGAASCIFALTMGVRAPLIAAIPIGFFWGLAIMNLDRWLVSAAKRRDRWHQNVTALLPRFFLALIIGTVISTPLVLRIFESEILAQLEITHQRKLQDHEELLQKDARFNVIPELETRVTALRALANGETNPGRTQDAEVERAQSEYDSLVKRYEEADKVAREELDGTGGTRVRGDGDAYRQKQKAADDLKRQRDEAKLKLDEAKARQQTTSGQKQSDAKNQLPTKQAELDRLKRLKKEEEDQFRATTHNDMGLLARMEALSRFTDRSPTLKTAYIVLLVFITSIEVLPVLTKFLMNCGPPSAYDQLLAEYEKRDAEAGRANLESQTRLRDAERDELTKRHEERIPERVNKLLDGKNVPSQARQERRRGLFRIPTGRPKPKIRTDPSGYTVFPPDED